MNVQLPRFIQIESGEYENADQRLGHQLYALGEDGNVYKRTRNKWVLMGQEEGEE